MNVNAAPRDELYVFDVPWQGLAGKDKWLLTRKLPSFSKVKETR